eukprot:CAMPEP_0198579338 /NCGR_PEP_ID=MMETSP1462-20131121/121425_1 /TAXON_ID=1333877 /ORGANISM="Brandtodinium nutriculum, Strain RCC3387" /LENGTH=84 /DNA_ID=CAMNT_0044310661 /DNA_START=422 /DNA_END=676 /DNA_ORIENTATION=+
MKGKLWSSAVNDLNIQAAGALPPERVDMRAIQPPLGAEAALLKIPWLIGSPLVLLSDPGPPNATGASDLLDHCFCYTLPRQMYL